MEKQEFLKEQQFSYDELCKYLQEKYGKPQGNYFINESCSSQNYSIKRSKEGLFIHHMGEYNSEYPKANNLGVKREALQVPFKFQTPDYLCYCNYLEHLILHQKIFELRCIDRDVSYVDDGFVHFLLPELRYYYEQNGKTLQQTKKAHWEQIKDNKKEFVKVYNDFYATHKDAPKYSYKEFLASQKGHLKKKKKK